MLQRKLNLDKEDKAKLITYFLTFFAEEKKMARKPFLLKIGN